MSSHQKSNRRQKKQSPSGTDRLELLKNSTKSPDDEKNFDQDKPTEYDVKQNVLNNNTDRNNITDRRKDASKITTLDTQPISTSGTRNIRNDIKDDYRDEEVTRERSPNKEIYDHYTSSMRGSAQNDQYLPVSNDAGFGEFMSAPGDHPPLPKPSPQRLNLLQEIRDKGAERNTSEFILNENPTLKRIHSELLEEVAHRKTREYTLNRSPTLENLHPELLEEVAHRKTREFTLNKSPTLKRLHTELLENVPLEESHTITSNNQQKIDEMRGHYTGLMKLEKSNTRPYEVFCKTDAFMAESGSNPPQPDGSRITHTTSMFRQAAPFLNQHTLDQAEIQVKKMKNSPGDFFRNQAHKIGKKLGILSPDHCLSHHCTHIMDVDEVQAEQQIIDDRADSYDAVIDRAAISDSQTYRSYF